MSLTPVRGPAAPIRARAAAPAALRRAAVVTADPRAPQPEVPAKAGSAALVNYYLYKAYQEARQDAAGYKARAALYGAALNEARVGAEAAARTLATARAHSAQADAVAVGPYNAAKDAHAAAHAKFQAPVDALSKQLRQAWLALDLAVHPGRPGADAKDTEARQLRQALEGLDDQIRDRYARLARLNPHAYDYGTQATALRDELRALENQQRPLFVKFAAASDAADAERAPQAGAQSPAVQAAKAKVAKLEAELTAAQATYRRETDKTLLGVDHAQQTYNRAMADFRAGEVDAERAAKTADALLAEVKTAFDASKPRMNWFERMGFKLFHGLDVNRLWETERRKALNEPEPPKKAK